MIIIPLIAEELPARKDLEEKTDIQKSAMLEQARVESE